MLLTKLRRLEVYSEHTYRLDFRSGIPSTGADSFPLECLSLRLNLVADSLPSLGRLTRLRHLQLVGGELPTKPVHTAAGELAAPESSVIIPTGCIRHWVRHLPLLESLALEDVHVPSGKDELGSLTQLQHLRSLNLMDQSLLQLSDFASLPLMPSLTDLRLTHIGEISLQPRDWMAEYVAAGEAAAAEREAAIAAQEQAEGGGGGDGEDVKMSTATAASDAASGAAAAESTSTPDAATSNDAAAAGNATADAVSVPSSMLALLSSCPSLLVLDWASSDSVIESSAAYTASNTQVRSKASSRQLAKERARDRQVLRRMMTAHTQLRVYSGGVALCNLLPARPTTPTAEESAEPAHAEDEETAAAPVAASSSSSSSSSVSSAVLDLARSDASAMRAERNAEEKAIEAARTGVRVTKKAKGKAKRK
jgi:hypothetical protein